MIMAAIETNEMKAVALGILQTLVLYIGLQTLCKIAEAVEGHGQAYMQAESELQFLVDSTEDFVDEDLSLSRFTDDVSTNSNLIKFDPLFFDFKEHPVGMPHMEQVTIYNPSTETSINLLYITANTVHFHCSFFQDKVLLPGGNTTFDIVFLGREEGPVDSTLYIQTSVGVFKYKVIGTAIPNPFRLRPFLGVRMPINSSFSPVITIHNPYSSSLQVTEMFTSGSDLHLELPLGGSEAPKQLWEIPPYETKPVIRASFVGRKENNHTAYIRIKTNSTSGDFIVLAVEVEVTAAPGIYAPADVLDFGLLRAHDEPKTIHLSLYNYGLKTVQLASIVVSPPNEAIKIEFQPIKVPPDTKQATPVAAITFNAKLASQLKHCSGKIVVKTKNNQYKLTIPYQATLLQGSFYFNITKTTFYSDQPIGNPVKRNVTITNLFNVSVIIHSIELPPAAEKYFSVGLFSSVVLHPNQEIRVFELTFHNTQSCYKLSTYIRLHTNISHFDLPLFCYSGRLRLYNPQENDSSSLQFGMLGLNVKHEQTFMLLNHNPIEVLLRGWGSNLSHTLIQLVAVGESNCTPQWDGQTNNMTPSFILRPFHFAVFKIKVTTPNHEGNFSGEVFVDTAFESIKVPFNFTTARGSLKVVPEVLTFKDAFPGRRSSEVVVIESSYSLPMTVTRLDSNPVDARFTFESADNRAVLLPGKKTKIGRVYFESSNDCSPTCYVGFDSTSQSWSRWLEGMSLPPDVSSTDFRLLKNQLSSWNSLVSSGKNTFSTQLELHTSGVQTVSIPATVSLTYPRLCPKSVLTFPLTQIGNTSVVDLVLHNPTFHPVLVQVLNIIDYPGASNLISKLRESLMPQLASYLNSGGSRVFTIQEGVSNLTLSTTADVCYSQSCPGPVHSNSKAFVIPPGRKVKLGIAFTAQEASQHTSMFVIRNNLTVFEILTVEGRGGTGQIRLGNRRPGTTNPLTFELTEKHLKDCDKPYVATVRTPMFTVKRSFTMRNIGDLPVFIHIFDINGSPCEGDGFKILNCKGFELSPNSSHKIEIAFSPDFTLSKVQRVLNIHSSLGVAGGVLTFLLVATLPAPLLGVCASALPRPSWEPAFFFGMLILIFFLLICIIFDAYLESEIILRESYLNDSQTIANLRNSQSTIENINSLDSRNTGRDISEPVKEQKEQKQNVELTNKTKTNKTASQTSLQKCESLKNTANNSNKKNIAGEVNKNTASKKSSKENRSHSVKERLEQKNGDKEDSIPLSKSDASLIQNILKELMNRGEGSINAKKNKKPPSPREMKGRKTSQTALEEETSSTTTESSDISEKEKLSHLPADKPKNTAHNTQRTKSQNRKEQLVTTEGGVKMAETDEFEVSLRSRRLKTEALLPNSIELPYRPHSVISSTSADAETRGKILRSMNNDQSTSVKKLEIKQKEPKKIPVIMVKGVPHLADTDTSNKVPESPPPLWGRSEGESHDLPTPTDIFARQHAPTKRTSTPPMPTTYSSVVSSNTESSKVPQAKILPIGKIVPEIKKSHPGAIGDKPKSLQASQNPWPPVTTNQLDDLRSSSPDSPTSFLLKSTPPPPGIPSYQSFNYNSPSNLGGASNPVFSYFSGSAASWDQGQETMEKSFLGLISSNTSGSTRSWSPAARRTVSDTQEYVGEASRPVTPFTDGNNSPIGGLTQPQPNLLDDGSSFDPFKGLRSIWGSASSSGSNQTETWGSQLFPTKQNNK